MPTNHTNDIRNICPGPTKPTNASVGMSGDSGGGKPPEITTVSERAMNSIPSVVMKLGMPKRIVTKPLTSPMAAHAAKPSATAATNGTPEPIETAMTMGISANVEPTERSNSPQIISTVTPMATSATSGRIPSTPRRFCAPRKMPSDCCWNTITSSTSSIAPASSGFCR